MPWADPVSFDLLRLIVIRNFTHISTDMMHIYTASAVLMAWKSCKDVYLTASVTWRCGCDPTDCSWTSRWLKCSGARRFAASIRFHHGLLVRDIRDLGIYVDSGLTMQVHVAKTVSLKQYRAVLRFFNEFTVFAGQWPNQVSSRS